MSHNKEKHDSSFQAQRDAFLDHIRKSSEEVQKWPEWKKGEYATVYYYNLNKKKTA